MELAVFKSLVDLGIGLFHFTRSLDADNRESRKRIGSWVEDLGILIESVAHDLESKQFPHSACAKMQYMIQSFPDVIDVDLQHVTDSKRLISLLNQAQNLEQLFGEMQTLYEDDRKVHIIKLKEIGGTLQGAGSVLTVL